MKYAKEELENSKRIYKSATPKLTVDWYVKWFASIILLTAMVIRSANISNTIDTILSFIGCLGWLFVAFIWKDRALIILNAVACFILLTGLLTKLFDTLPI
jgi:ABC-type siderophore export system fused ATPase/permease subunit